MTRRATLAADDRDEAHAAARHAAEVVRQPERRPLDLARPGLAAELQPHLVHHAQPGGADRVAERLEPAIGVDGESAVEIEETVHHVLPRRAARAEAEILAEH